MTEQEESEVLRDLICALDEAEQAGTSTQALTMLAWGCGVGAWWHPKEQVRDHSDGPKRHQG